MAPLALEKDTAKRLDEFRANVTKTAEDVVFKTFPQKILDLQDFLDKADAESSEFHISHTTKETDPVVYPEPVGHDEPDVKKRKRVDGQGQNAHPNSTTYARLPSLVHANPNLSQVYQKVKRESEQLIQLSDQVKLWVNLTMPKIEDGDNFGVQVQEEVLTELLRAQESAVNMRDTCRVHHLGRAKICSKLIKYPNVEDYTIALREHDERQHYMARQNLYDLRNIYAVMTDIIHKNIVKLRAPKGNNAGGLY